VRLINEQHATVKWSRECPPFPHTRLGAVQLLFPTPEVVHSYLQGLSGGVKHLARFEVVFTEKLRPNDNNLPLHYRFVVDEGVVRREIGKYDVDRLVDVLPISDDIMQWRFIQAENKMAFRSWVQAGGSREERQARASMRWYEYYRRLAATERREQSNGNL
jgi:hypothetical protein